MACPEQSHEVGQHKGVEGSRAATLLPFFFNDTATTEIYTLSLHDALPIYGLLPVSAAPRSAQVASAHPFHKQPLLLKKEASGTSRKEALGKGQCSNYYPVTTEIEVCL